MILKWCDICKKQTLHNGHNCIICNPESKCGGSKNYFIEKENILYYFDYKILDYIKWKDYKKKFIIQNIDFKLPNEFQWILTFRTQNSQNWSGAHLAFEQNLVDENIKWFVYIKFYINNSGNIKPLVVGKSGSKLVNNSGSDISFSTDVNDGPARRFLKDEDFNWYKTHIAILKCNSEQEAYYKEKYYIRKFNLFGS